MHRGSPVARWAVGDRRAPGDVVAGQAQGRSTVPLTRARGGDPVPGGGRGRSGAGALVSCGCPGAGPGLGNAEKALPASSEALLCLSPTVRRGPRAGPGLGAGAPSAACTGAGTFPCCGQQTVHPATWSPPDAPQTDDRPVPWGFLGTRAGRWVVLLPGWCYPPTAPVASPPRVDCTSTFVTVPAGAGRSLSSQLPRVSTCAVPSLRLNVPSAATS